MQRHGLTFNKAVEVAAEKAGLQLQPSSATLPPPKPRPLRAAKPPLSAPARDWQQTQHHYIKRAEVWLWHRDNRAAVDYLRGRGLREETIRQAHLGYDPNRQIILLPWYIGGELWRVGARSLVKGKHPAVSGYRQGLYNADQLTAERPALLLEGEFDALIVAQEAGDLVTPVATGGITAARQTRWVTALARLPQVWVAFDDDPPGEQAAEWWLEVLAHNARRQRPIGAKDPNGMHLAGMDLRQWLGGRGGGNA